MNFTSNEYISSHFLNFLYYADEEQICDYILRNVNLNHFKKKYYSLIGHDFDSEVNDSLLVVIANKGNIENSQHLFNYFTRILDNKLKNRLKYYKQECRNKEIISPLEAYYDLSDPVAEADFLEAELLADIKNSKADEITKKYVELIVTSKDKISDLEASRLLGVNVKTIKAKKKIIKNFLIAEMQ